MVNKIPLIIPIKLVNKIPRNNEKDYFQYLISDVDNFPGTFTFSSVTVDHVGVVIGVRGFFAVGQFAS